MSRPTLKDVAARAGVSVSTVSYALNEHSTLPLADSTKARIRRIARELGYVPNGVARSLQARSSRTVGVLLNKPLGIPRYALIVQGISRELNRLGYHLALLSGDPTDSVADVRGGRLDGLIFVGHDDQDVPHGLANSVSEHAVPFVALDCGASEEQRAYSTVDFDYSAGADEMMSYLAHQGIRSIYYVRPDLDSRAEQIRERAVLAALGEWPEVTLSVVSTGVTTNVLRALDADPERRGHTVDVVSRVATAVDAGASPPGQTAIVCSWGAYAEAAYRVAQHRDSRITVGALAAGALSPELWPGLVYSRLPLEDAGSACARLLVRATEPDAAPEHLLLNPTLQPS